MDSVVPGSGAAALAYGIKKSTTTEKDIKGFRRAAIEELDEEANVLIDERSREVAQELLNSPTKRASKR